MTPAVAGAQNAASPTTAFSWTTIAWGLALLALCYAPMLNALVRQGSYDPDMGHGFAVPAIAAFIAWQKRDQIVGRLPIPNWWGLAIMAWAGFQLYIATLGAGLFLAR